MYKIELLNYVLMEGDSVTVRGTRRPDYDDGAAGSEARTRNSWNSHSLMTMMSFRYSSTESSGGNAQLIG